MSQSAKEMGWEAPVSNSGVYLRLKQKGDKARIRIASLPLKFVEHYEANGDRAAKDASAWGVVVLHKELIDDKPVTTVRAFKMGAMIYGLVYDLVNNPDWGDPALYDIEVTRTEQEGRYYTVQPLPKPMGPISEAHKALLAEANLDLHALFVERTASKGTEGVSDSEDPFAED